MNRPIVLAVLFVFVVSCSLSNQNTGSIATLATTETLAVPTLATPTLAATETLATQTPETYRTQGDYNLRAEAGEHGDHIGWVYSGTRVLIKDGLILEENMSLWLYIKTIEENPDDVLEGWISGKAIK